MRMKILVVPLGAVLACGVVSPVAHAGELDELMKGVKSPKQQTVSSPQTSPPTAGLNDMLKERTGNFAKEWAKDAKGTIKNVLVDLPTSPVFITQLLMNAALPSVGDVLAKAMNQGQQGGQFQGGTLGSLSTLLAGDGGQGGGGGSSVEAAQLTACLKAGADAEDCIADPEDAMKNKLPAGMAAVGTLQLSTVLTNAGLDAMAWELLGEVTANANGITLGAPGKSPYSLVSGERCPTTHTSHTDHPLACQIDDASDGDANNADPGEFWTVLQALGLPFSVYKLYWNECGAKFGEKDANQVWQRCKAIDSLATLVAVGETLRKLGGIEAQLADAEAQTNGWQLVHGGSPLFPMIQPYLASARPRIQAMRVGLEASTGLSLQSYGERLEKLKLLADAIERERTEQVRARLGR